MDRRAFLGTMAGAFLIAPPVAKAQQAGRPWKIGLLAAGSLSGVSHLHEALRQGLREFGYTDGQNVTIETRAAEGRFDRLPQLAVELATLKMDVILAPNTPTTLAAKQATSTIPIVMMGVGDPVGAGFVSSLARPGGNITGLSGTFGQGFSGKWVELIKEAVPTATRIAAVANPANTLRGTMLKDLEATARTLNVKFRSFDVKAGGDFESVFSAIAGWHADALVVLPDPVFFSSRKHIVELVAKTRLPAIAGFREFVDEGGVMSYGVNQRYLFHRAAFYVDKILKGAKPAELPVEQPTKFELVINLKAAKAMGLTIPPSLLQRADQVIE